MPQLASSLILDLQEPFSLDTVLPPRSAADGAQRSVGGNDYPTEMQV